MEQVKRRGTHCSAEVVPSQRGVQGRRQPWTAQVPDEETWAAEWECEEGSCHCWEPLKEQRRLDRTESRIEMEYRYNK